MTSQGHPAASALQALAQDGTLTGSCILDPARSEVRLESRHTWGLRPLHGIFRQVTGNRTGPRPARPPAPSPSLPGRSTPRTRCATRTCGRPSSSTSPATRTSSTPSTAAARQRGPPADRQPDRPRPHSPALLPRDGLRRRGRDPAGRRGPDQPGRLRPDIQPDADGVAEQHHHCPRRVHPPISPWRTR